MTRLGVGWVISALISFISVAVVLFFLVKMYNKATKKVDEDAGPSETDLLIQIRDALSK